VTPRAFTTHNNVSLGWLTLAINFATKPLWLRVCVCANRVAQREQTTKRSKWVGRWSRRVIKHFIGITDARLGLIDCFEHRTKKRVNDMHTRHEHSANTLISLCTRVPSAELYNRMKNCVAPRRRGKESKWKANWLKQGSADFTQTHFQNLFLNIYTHWLFLG